MKKDKHIAVLVLFAAALWPATGKAEPVRWVLKASFSNGDTATGYIVFDANTLVVSDSRIKVSGRPQPALTYTPSNTQVGAVTLPVTLVFSGWNAYLGFSLLPDVPVRQPKGIVGASVQYFDDQRGVPGGLATIKALLMATAPYEG